MQVGVMVFGIGNLADAVKEIESGGNVFNAPFAADASAVGDEFPLGDGREEFLREGFAQRFGVFVAGDAVSFFQVGGSDIHGCSFFLYLRLVNCATARTTIA